MKKRRIIFLLIFDIIAINMAYFISYYFRYGSQMPRNMWESFLIHMFVITLIKILVFSFFKLYKSVWELASIDELVEIVLAVLISNALTLAYLIFMNLKFSRSIFFMIPIIDMALVGGVRFSYRIFRRLKRKFTMGNNYKRILIVGAGAAGNIVLKEIRNHEKLNSKPIAFIDDDPRKKNMSINRIPVVGNSNDIDRVCEKYDIDEIIIAIPSAKAEDKKRILNICKETKCKTKTLPGMYELIGGQINISRIRDVEIEDLLGRDTVGLDLDKLSDLISDKTILVTGGGGSIGSELSRQIAMFNPKKLMILEIYENNAYDIQLELLRKHENLNLEIIIASVRDKKRINEIIRDERPDVVFHAAAHKHVPMMEANPKAAVKNNIFGTLNLVEAADKYGVEKFVLISTDKAVNPTNIMGATKRVCEKIIQTYNSISKTDYVAVRFGNVLGSNGSVIPLFKKQIAEGGPVTVTDSRVIRYFMTIPEACGLVLQTGSMAHGGEIFVLDMGEQVKIINLAKDLIKLSGFKPNVDMPIKITGLRPGEKLYEEILIDQDKMIKTDHNKIFIEEPMKFTYEELMKNIDLLEKAINHEDGDKVKKALLEIVPGYMPCRDNLNSELS